MLICFDLDDTLLDHTRAEHEAALHFGMSLGSAGPVGEAFVKFWREVAEKHMASFLRGEVSFQEQRRRRVREVTGRTLSDTDADGLFYRYLGVYEAHWKLFDDVNDCLAALSVYRLGVISNGNQEQQLKKLRHTGIESCFRFVLSAERAGVAKPDRAIFVEAAKYADRSDRNCFYVGDNLTVDAEAAKRAGWQGIWLDRKGSKRVTPLPTISSLQELPTLIDRLSRTNKSEPLS